MNYIITSAQKNAGVNKTLLQNILLFANKHSVEKIYIFPMAGKYRDEERLDKVLNDEKFDLADRLRLNNNLIAYDSKILPQQIDPFRGMNSKLSRDYSYILPSPKIRYKSIPNTSKYPRALISTGAITRPNYKVHTAHGRKALEQHQYGFVFVEIKDKTYFNVCQIEATQHGDFHYLDEKYYSGVFSKARPEALILGDWHTGDTDPEVRRRTIKMIEELNPERVVFHDLFNGHSINHHERGNLLAELRLLKNNREGLLAEAQAVFHELNYFARKFPKTTFFVVRSNHDDFLEKYIKSKVFIDDPHNFLFACQIIPRIVDARKIPLEEMLGLIGNLEPNIRFFQEDESYRVRGIELANHGHLGSNGSKGSPEQYSRNNMKMITGHTHSPALLANGMTVGTSTHLRVDYSKGASSWLHAHGILYPNGKYGLITII